MPKNPKNLYEKYRIPQEWGEYLGKGKTNMRVGAKSVDDDLEKNWYSQAEQLRVGLENQDGYL